MQMEPTLRVIGYIVRTVPQVNINLGHETHDRVGQVVWHKPTIQGLCKHHTSPESRVCAKPPDPVRVKLIVFTNFLKIMCLPALKSCMI